jgi:hypothetical protein
MLFQILDNRIDGQINPGTTMTPSISNVRLFSRSKLNIIGFFQLPSYRRPLIMIAAVLLLPMRTPTVL